MNPSATAQKIDLIHWITELNDLSILDKVSAIKEGASTMPHAELLSIERGLDDFQQGKVVPHEQVKKRYEKWL